MSELIKKQEDGSVVYTLQYPVEHNGEVHRQLTLKRPKGRHIKSISGDPTMKDLLALASQVSGQLPSMIDEIDAVDCIQIAGILGNFLGNGPEIGKT